MSISKYDFVKLFKSLSDETRLRIIRIFFHGFFNVNEIRHITQAKQSNISHHLKILQEAGVVSNKKEGSIIYYKLNEIDNNESLNKIIDFIKSEEENISFYNDDLKRMESILDDRKKHAEEFSIRSVLHLTAFRRNCSKIFIPSKMFLHHST